MTEEAEVPEEDRYVQHFLDIYNINLFVAVTKRQQKTLEGDIAKWVGKKAVFKPPKGCAGATTSYLASSSDGSSPGFIVAFWMDQSMWFADGRPVAKLAALCAHEATHAAGMIWDQIQAEIDTDTLADDEPLPYLVGWLTELLFNSTYEKEK